MQFVPQIVIPNQLEWNSDQQLPHGSNTDIPFTIKKRLDDIEMRNGKSKLDSIEITEKLGTI